jgi:multidrug resistance efflux pump
MPTQQERLEKLLKQEEQLKARVQQAKARIRSQDDKVRTGRLIAWGVVIEQKLNEGELKPEDWAQECQRFLKSSERTLERALTGPLEGLTPGESEELPKTKKSKVKQ